jgi:hypothetical protein
MEALEGQEDSLNRWLRDEVVPGHQEYLADPAKAIPAHQLLARIKTRRVR